MSLCRGPLGLAAGPILGCDAGSILGSYASKGPNMPLQGPIVRPLPPRGPNGSDLSPDAYIHDKPDGSHGVREVMRNLYQIVDDSNCVSNTFICLYGTIC